jgi:Ca2+-binding EF-hand superfamily protein
MRRWRLAGVAAVAALAPVGAGAQALPDPMRFGTAYEQLAFEAADTDGDSLVSEAEFVRDAAAAFSGLDADRDLKLSPQELNGADPATYARLDANRDGFLSFDEVMKNKIAAFAAADKDQDGALSFTEMVDSVRTEVSK